ncbi:MAG: glycosyltransferase family 39 protein, partial [Pirellulaceae bacterium]
MLMAVALVGGYSVFCLGAPLLPTLDADGQVNYLARWQALLVRLTYPDGILQSWTAGGRMGLAMADRLPLLVGVACWMASGWWIGRAVMGWAVAGWACDARGRRWVTGMHGMERWGLEALLGLALISHGLLALGLLGGIGTRWPLVCGLVLALLAAWRCGRRLPMERDLENEVQESQSSGWERRWVQLGWMVIAFLSVLIVWGSLMPPIEFDVRAYHLQAPKEFFQRGAIGWVDHNVYANMPLGAEMHALGWMVLWGGEDGWYWGALIGKGVIAAHAVLAALLLAGHLTRLAGRLSGMGAGLLWLGTPGIAEVSRLGLIEGVLAAYLAACWVVMHQLIALRVNQLRGWFLLGIFAGAAAACKYTAMPFVVAPVLLLATGWHSRLGERWWNQTEDRMRQLAQGWLPRVVWILVAGMFLGGGGWYLKNGVLGGNPVFPLAGG